MPPSFCMALVWHLEKDLGEFALLVEERNCRASKQGGGPAWVASSWVCGQKSRMELRLRVLGLKGEHGGAKPKAEGWRCWAPELRQETRWAVRTTQARWASRPHALGWTMRRALSWSNGPRALLGWSWAMLELGRMHAGLRASELLVLGWKR
ncbi:unnamed protein product [Prunus armeniaca]